MNADLTFNTIVYKKSYDEVDGSLRQSIARGVNTPDKLVLKSQDYVDSTNKVPGRRHTFSVDRVDIDANLAPIQTRVYGTVVIPSTSSQAALDNVIATFKAVVADAGFLTSVTNNEK